MNIKIRNKFIEIKNSISDSFIIFNKVPYMIRFGIGKWTKSMLSITSCQQCSIVHTHYCVSNLITSSSCAQERQDHASQRRA